MASSANSVSYTHLDVYKRQFKNLSPKISVDYQLTPDILLYGLASRGFKSGGYNIRANATAVPRSAEPFDDEKVDSCLLYTSRCV